MNTIGKGSGWNNLARKPGAHGVFLVLLNAGGRRFAFSTTDIEVQSNDGPIKFVGCIMNDLKFTESVDIYSYGTEDIKGTSMEIEVPHAMFPYMELRRSFPMQIIEAKVLWTIYGSDIPLEDCITIAEGYVTEPVFGESERTMRFVVNDKRFDMDRPFPGSIASTDLISTLDVGDEGKPYPFIIGSVKNVPALRLGYDIVAKRTYYLVAGDPLSELAAGACTDIYDGDTPLLIMDQGQQIDSDGEAYWRVEVFGNIESNSVTANVVGYQWNRVTNVMRHLVAAFTEKRDLVDVNFFAESDLYLAGIGIEMLVNSRAEEGVVRFIQKRLGAQFPLYLVRFGNRLAIRPLRWESLPVRILTYDRNILKCTRIPAETPRSEIYSEFVVNYGKEAMLGDNQGSIKMDRDTHFLAYKAYQLVGRSTMRDFEINDADGEVSAGVGALHLLDIKSRIRVSVSYECTLEVLGVNLLDNVIVIDKYEGWTHRPQFKIVGITLGTGSTVLLDLLSRDDYEQVYNINRREVGETLVRAPRSQSEWGDGLPGGVVDTGDGPHGIPDF